MSAPLSPAPPSLEIYVAIEGNQQGPFADEVIQRMLAAGQIQPDSLSWIEGMGDWAPLNSWYGPAKALIPAASRRHERLARLSFYFGTGVLVSWLFLFIAAGNIRPNGSEGLKMAVGFLFMLGAALNVIGVVLGWMAASGQVPRPRRAVLGIGLNLLTLLLFVALIIIGLTAH